MEPGRTCTTLTMEPSTLKVDWLKAKYRKAVWQTLCLLEFQDVALRVFSCAECQDKGGKTPSPLHLLQLYLELSSISAPFTRGAQQRGNYLAEDIVKQIWQQQLWVGQGVTAAELQQFLPLLQAAVLLWICGAVWERRIRESQSPHQLVLVLQWGPGKVDFRRQKKDLQRNQSCV